MANTYKEEFLLTMQTSIAEVSELAAKRHALREKMQMLERRLVIEAEAGQATGKRLADRLSEVLPSVLDVHSNLLPAMQKLQSEYTILQNRCPPQASKQASLPFFPART